VGGENIFMKKILVITDMDSVGSGYKHICVPLFTELMKLDDYEIKVIGMMYQGQEHNYPFSVIPAVVFEEAIGAAHNLIQIWFPDVVLVAMDLPLQQKVSEMLSPLMKRTPPEIEQGLTGSRKYIAITPLESGPLVLDWAMPLVNMDAVFFISQLGADEAQKVGITKAEHLQVGCDTVLWHPATPEEKKQFRDGLGIPQDAFVVLTVADNQERKNLWYGMESIVELKKLTERPIRYILVTREQNPYGGKLRSGATELGINKELVIYERGMSQKDLWALYAISDAYLQPSKAEGLGLPVLDAMCMKIPVVATDVGAMTELLQDGRGFLIPGHSFRDVWGNSWRVLIDYIHAATELAGISSELYNHDVLERAYLYVVGRAWDIPAKQLHNKIQEMFG
jgi:glycosyltransferase involved in cell wall biosynthesis